jgi:peptidoglycan/xylan/chitin deacetylase (PgdA/CDA1 family)
VERAVFPEAVILLYHRVAEVKPDPQLLCVTREHFAEHLQVLRDGYQPMSLAGLVDSMERRQIPRGAVAVTFDDGYADNLLQAKPVLAKHGVPATVFVTSGQVGSGREFWWDEVERVFLGADPLPDKLSLNIEGTVLEAEMPGGVERPTDGENSCTEWSVADRCDPTPRHSAYRSVCRRLRPLEPRRRQRALDELLAWGGMEPVARPSHRPLSADEVAKLAQNGLVEVGAHTVHHPVLAALPLAPEGVEIRSSKTQLEEMLGRPVQSFAYPYGSPRDYTPESVHKVREAGFRCACSNFAARIRRRSDLYQLPRFLVRDWGGEEFARRLSEWFRSL